MADELFHHHARGAAAAKDSDLPDEEKGKGGWLKQHRLEVVSAVAGIVGLIIIIYLRSKSSSSTAATPTTASTLQGTAPGEYGNSGYGGWGGGGGSSTPTPTTTTPTPTTTTTTPAPGTSGAPTLGQSVGVGGTDTEASPAGAPVNTGGNVVQTGGYTPSTGWLPGSTITSPSGTEVIGVAGGGPTADMSEPTETEQELYDSVVAQPGSYGLTGVGSTTNVNGTMQSSGAPVVSAGKPS